MKHAYPEQWQQFLSADTVIPTLRYHWPQWHKGRSRFCFWALLPDDADLEQQLAECRQKLSAYLLADYHKQTHITLYAAGFLCKQECEPDDVSETELDRQEAAIRQLKLPKFTVQTASINSFAGAPFVEVVDEAGYLQRLHQALTALSGKDRDNELIAHLTLGLYQQAFSTCDMAYALDTTMVKPLSIHCTELHLLAYDASDIRSPLISLRQIELNKQ